MTNLQNHRSGPAIRRLGWSSGNLRYSYQQAKQFDHCCRDHSGYGRKHFHYAAQQRRRKHRWHYNHQPPVFDLSATAGLPPAAAVRSRPTRKRPRSRQPERRPAGLQHADRARPERPQCQWTGLSKSRSRSGFPGHRNSPAIRQSHRSRISLHNSCRHLQQKHQANWRFQVTARPVRSPLAPRARRLVQFRCPRLSAQFRHPLPSPLPHSGAR